MSLFGSGIAPGCGSRRTWKSLRRCLARDLAVRARVMRLALPGAHSECSHSSERTIQFSRTEAGRRFLAGGSCVGVAKLSCCFALRQHLLFRRRLFFFRRPSTRLQVPARAAPSASGGEGDCSPTLHRRLGRFFRTSGYRLVSRGCASLFGSREHRALHRFPPYDWRFRWPKPRNSTVVPFTNRPLFRGVSASGRRNIVSQPRMSNYKISPRRRFRPSA